MRKILFTISVLFLVGCNSSDTTPAPIPSALNCPVDALTAFQQLYNPLNTTAFPESLSGYSTAITHEYTFKVTTAATICSVGYQSQPALSTMNYQIDIYDTVTNSVVSTINSTFASNMTSYVGLTTPLVLIAGRSYKIRRYSPATLGSPNGAGRCISNNVTGAGNVSFPKTFGNLTITASDFYTQTLIGTVSAGANNGIPYIDIVFQ